MTTSRNHNDPIDFDNYFFIGVGGIGMSALARYYKTKGKYVVGYDRTPTALTEALEKEGVSIHYEDEIQKIPDMFDATNTQVVYTPAIPAGHKQLNYFKEHNFQLSKRSQVLGQITKQNFTIAVAGTHGKTTTSTMIAHLLKSVGKNVTAFLGGISTNYNSNYLEANTDIEEIVVVEADEFDRSFLTLSPDLAVITSVEADHLDIYGNGGALEESFVEFSKQVKTSLVVQDDFKHHFGYKYSYGLEQGDLFAKNITVRDRKFVFDIQTPFGLIEELELKQPGYHNVENVLATIAIALELKIEPEEIKKAFTSYSGVKRRFEWIINRPDLVYIDDYAHHPTEIRQCIRSIKRLMDDKDVTVIFQPHLYSRTRDFAQGFAESLSLADNVILLDIYPARELPIRGVSSKMLLKDLQNSGVRKCCKKEELAEVVASLQPEVVATLGAGDIDKLVKPLKERLTQKYA